MKTHPRGATPKARVWTVAVIEAEVRAQCGGPLGRADVRRPIRPLAQQRLNQALGLAVRLRMVRPSESVTNRPGATGGGKDARAIGEAVIAEKSTDADPTAAVPANRPSQEGGTGRRILGGEHLDVRHARRIIDGDMKKFPADTPGTAAAIAMNPMANALNAAEALHIDVKEITGMRPLIAMDGRGRLARGHAIEVPTRQDPRDRGTWHRQRRADLPRRGPGPPQRDNGRFRCGPEPARLPMRARRPVAQLTAIPGQPLGDRPDADPGGLCSPALRPALLAHAVDEQLALIHVGLRATMGFHSGAPPEAMGWLGKPPLFPETPE